MKAPNNPGRLKTPRERVWQAILECKLPHFNSRDIQELCTPTVKIDTVREYMAALALAGYIEQHNSRAAATTVPRPPVQWVVVKRVAEAPRLTRSGETVTQGIATLAMWRCMRVLKTFNATQLAQAASVDKCQVSENTAKTYISHLAAAGYLATVTPSRPGVQAIHRLVRNTGPHAPAITRRKVVFDRNTGAFAELQTAQEVTDGLE